LARLGTFGIDFFAVHNHQRARHSSYVPDDG
jgi:hypothetical protein